MQAFGRPLAAPTAVWNHPGIDLTTRLFLRRPPQPVFRAVLRLRHLLARSRRRLLPANGVVIESTLLAAEARALGVAAELDLAEHLARGPLSADVLAARAGVDTDALERLLHLLTTAGYFRRDRRERWRNTRLSKVLRDDHPLSTRDWARFFGGPHLMQFWSRAADSVRTGQSATAAVTGHDFFTWSSQVEPAAGALFDGAMRDGSRLVGLSIDREVDLTGVQIICDVGGGTGRLLIDLLARHPERRGILFDLPEVVAGATRPLADADLADRVDVVGGSFFEGLPPGADRYVLVSVIHDWDDDRAVEILGSCRDALGPGGRVLVVDQVLDPTEAPFISRHTDLMMLVLTGAGRERTRDDFDRLFAQSGLRVARTYRLATPHTVFELQAAAGRP